jgi:hypothetical protein
MEMMAAAVDIWIPLCGMSLIMVSQMLPLILTLLTYYLQSIQNQKCAYKDTQKVYQIKNCA